MQASSLSHWVYYYASFLKLVRGGEPTRHIYYQKCCPVMMSSRRNDQPCEAMYIHLSPSVSSIQSAEDDQKTLVAYNVRRCFKEKGVAHACTRGMDNARTSVSHGRLYTA